LNANGFEAEAIAGGKGQYDVLRDGQLVFSKRDTGRFPSDGEIVASLRA
jgi:hypothetical protein